MDVGLLHPGEMGAAVGRCLCEAGHKVLWASAGRGEATATRARDAGLTDAGSVAAISARVPIVLSICPPHAALDIAREVAGCGFRGLFVDANAIAPATARSVGAVIVDAGGTFADGGIIGPPPVPASPGHTRLYLSGDQAATIGGLFTGTAVDARTMPGDAGAASAVKMSYAAWTKGTAALLLAIRALARAEGVEDALLAEWALSQPSLPARSEQAARSAAAKGWRWIAEMDEIAASMAADDLPGGFHQAAADIYRRSATSVRPDLDTVLAALPHRAARHG
ncbi:MAG: NAD(P)-dependent oxidoreductase [Streptosporangiaceae bacterium]|nr:NAD(P)-dependent oxidoreductase [Streptosporangiaceae bacterium]